MGRPGLALRLLEGLEPDARHVFCFVALRARALLAMGFPQEALRELEACEKVADHSRRTSWRVRIVRIVALARSGMPSVARTAFDTLVVDVPPRWWGGVINWARFPELREHAERLGVPGPQGTDADDVLREPLTRREAELLTLLRGDASVQQLAAEQFVSLNTIKTHLRNLYRKLGAASRPDAVDRAMRAGLFDAFRFLEE
jgi:LuxR family maltose regulon positive regulatory protein